MRLFLLPISTRQNLIYCQRINQQLSQQQSYVDKITSKASSRWLEWEKAEKGWQKWVTVNGNKLFRRIPYEEWGLKSIPPLSVQTRKMDFKERKKIEVVFPRSLIKSESILDLLENLSSQRQGYHRKRMWFSIVGMPFTLPVGLIPILPNLPFFYLVFRAWSHWRALSGSKHLEFLVQNKLLYPSPSPVLDKLYPQHQDLSKKNPAETTSSAAPSSNSESSATAAQEQHVETMLLSQSSGKAIAQSLKVPELEAEMERAIEQVRMTIWSQTKLEEERRKATAATKGPQQKLEHQPIETGSTVKDGTLKKSN